MRSGVSTRYAGFDVGGAESCLLPVNVILVVGHEKLNVEMQRTYGNRMAVVKIPKSGGVCLRASLAWTVLTDSFV